MAPGYDLHERLIRAGSPDPQSVTADGGSCHRLIDGVKIRDLVLHTDERGTVCEMFDPRWNWHPDPLVFVYCFTVRPGWAKGWAMHQRHEDRYCLLQGEMKVVLFDARPDSPTHGLINEIHLSEQRRQLVNIPAGVWHADENIGMKDALTVNFPTIQYDHAAPDKVRLPLDTNLIPYRFRHAKAEA
jgi:dTDP-4-dehydrorhamnose 3,5-epimerase